MKLVLVDKVDGSLLQTRNIDSSRYETDLTRARAEMAEAKQAWEKHGYENLVVLEK